MNLAQFKLFVNNIPDEYNLLEVVSTTDDEGNGFRPLNGIGIELARNDYGEWEFFEEGYHDEEDKKDFKEIGPVLSGAGPFFCAFFHLRILLSKRSLSFATPAQAFLAACPCAPSSPQ